MTLQKYYNKITTKKYNNNNSKQEITKNNQNKKSCKITKPKVRSTKYIKYV